MKLSTKQKNNVLQVHDAYWTEYLKGNVKAMEALLDDSYSQVGSAESEVFSNKKEAIKFLYETIDEVSGKLEMRNRNTRLEQQDGVVLIHERCDLYALDGDKWVFYSKFRATTFLQERKTGWKFIHQHSSFPDSKTEEGENVAIDKIAEENRDLREAVKRRTTELEQTNRELEIEAALERVRSRSMAMHKSEELAELSLELVKQVQALGVATWFCAFNIYDDDPKGSLEWGSNGQGTFPKYRTPREGIFLRYYEAGKRGETLLINEIGEDECPAHYEYLCTLPGVGEQLLKMKDNGIPFPTSQIDHVAYFKYGYVLFITYEPTPESHEIFIRFAKVFEQTYTRFLDLKKAEAQAWEAQIEVALEKIRSRTMAMQHSDELPEAANLLFLEVQALGIPAWSAGYCIWETEDMKTASCSMSSESELQKSFSLPTIGEGYNFYDPANKGESFYVKELGGKALEKHYEFMRTLPKVGDILDNLLNAGLSLPTFQIFHIVFFTHGYLMFITYEPVPEAHGIFKRFGNVFEQTYTRFLDLKKAEAQAREAQIEGALERVRSKTMAMHNSRDLEDIVISLFEEVMNLGLDKSIRCGIGILEGHEGMETRSVNKSSDGTLKLRTGMLNMTIHPMLVGLKKAWKNGSTEYSYDYTAKDVRKYYEALNNEPEYPFNANLEVLPEQEFHRSFFYSSGILFAFSENPISEESSKVLARFATVFGQTYRRFLDLQEAEDRAKDAVKQASLDRVRGQIASMRSTQDLERITPLVWNELTTLGIPFIRCGVFIIDESDKTVQAFLSAPDGHSLGAMRIPFDADKDTAASVAHWKKNEVYKTHWDKSQFLEFMQLMIDLGQVSNEKEYQGAEQPPDSLHLHFVPFTQGMLYVGNEESLEEDQIELVQSLADSFAIAYARYEDFVRLEKAKKQVENTLEELKSTQNQLVQSEKMASLGELTAGIAHEIQNPLNFVNNFSEVSVELLEELQEEMKKGDMEEVNALIEDIQQNLGKINHHGQRADGIVKGMLQHSRAGSGEKELTDLNVLADEYLRLAYHGLRAKDKTFNAIIETHFDEGLGKVNVVPQDIGRVILNLITNAFYVVKEKGEQQPEGYEPSVTVTTIKKNDKVLLRVKDNGNGIPNKIKDKIFQPFFTTKPTGEGTGLGLSMSYDIVTKGHGGELQVETKEGQGTEFTIELPVK